MLTKGTFVLLLEIVAVWVLSVSCTKISSSTVADQAWLAEKRINHEAGVFAYSKTHVFRLRPGEDILASIYKYARALNIKSAVILTCVGSLTRVNIRFANQPNGTALSGHFEIVSLVGTVDYQFQTLGDRSSSPTGFGYGHVHISCGDETGKTYSGHLLEGSIVYTTAEIALSELVGGLFVQELDSAGSGYNELKIFHTDDPSAPAS